MQRFLTDVERTRRAAGWVFVAVGLPVAALLIWGVIAAGRVTVTSLVLLAFAAAVIACGLRLALNRRVAVDVDVDSRTYVLIRDGKRAGSGPLDTLGPLVVSKRTRLAGSGGKARTVIEYVVNPRAHSELDFFVMDTPGKARQKMEALARAWGLPCRSHGGAVRAADALDKPLHERLRGDAEATAITPLRPEWNLRIEPLSPGYAIVSTHRSWAPLMRGGMLLLPALLVLGTVSGTGLVSTLQEAGSDLMDRVFRGLMGVLLLALLWKLWEGVRDTFFPGTIRVTHEGVSYRGSTMAFGEIEEVTGGVPIEIVGDRRILNLPVSFCPPQATSAVARELQRMILDVAG